MKVWEVGGMRVVEGREVGDVWKVWKIGRYWRYGRYIGMGI